MELDYPRRKVGAPTETSEEKLIDEITNRLKTNGDVSVYKKNRKITGFVTLLSKLNDLPKTIIPSADLLRVKNQMLDRIVVPQIKQETYSWFGFTATLPQILRISAGVLGTLLIVISLSLGTAVVALNSVPGQAVYPLKKIVENIELKLASQDQQTNLQLKFADNRIDELQQVLQQQQSGQLSPQDAQKIVSATVKDIQKSTIAAAKSATAQQPKTVIATKLADISNKLKIASIQSEGQVKIELEQASQDIQQAGIKAQGSSTVSDNSVSAQGKLTAVADTYVSIGSAKFLINKDTKYVDITAADLKIDQVVDIEGQIVENKTYAQTITLVADLKTSSDIKTDSSATQTIPPVSQ